MVKFYHKYYKIVTKQFLLSITKFTIDFSSCYVSLEIKIKDWKLKRENALPRIWAPWHLFVVKRKSIQIFATIFIFQTSIDN